MEYLDGMKISGYETYVSKVSKLITLTKGKKSYMFLVDSDYNIKDLNGTEISINSGNGNQTENENFIPVVSVSGMSFTINSNITEFNDIKSYVYIIDNEVKKVDENSQVTINGLSKGSHTVKVKAIRSDATILESKTITKETGDEFILYDYTKKDDWFLAKGSGIDVTFNEEYADFQITEWNSAYVTFRTKTTFDLSKYSKIGVILETGSDTSADYRKSGIVFDSEAQTAAQGHVWRGSWDYKFDPNLSKTTKYIDISQVNSNNQYIYFVGLSTRTKLYKIWIE